MTSQGEVGICHRFFNLHVSIAISPRSASYNFSKFPDAFFLKSVKTFGVESLPHGLLTGVHMSNFIFLSDLFVL